MDKETLISLLQCLNLPSDVETCEALVFYEKLVRERTNHVNLVSKKDSSRIMERHIFDSLALASILAPLDGKIIHDLGSGAGFPCFPIKIVFPVTTVYSIESRTKKAGFQKEAADSLGLENIYIINTRAELLAGKEGDFLPTADLILVRAMGSHLTVLEYSKKRLSNEGRLIIFRSNKPRSTDNLVDIVSHSIFQKHIEKRIFNPAITDEIDIAIISQMDNCPKV